VLTWIEQTTGITNYPLIFTVAFVIAVSLPVGLLALASRIAAAGNLENTLMNFARFGYALIPLDIAAHVAHNLFHLLAEGSLVFSTVASLFGAAPANGATPLASPAVILILQLTILALGIAGSAYTVRRIANRRYGSLARRRATTVPFMVLLGILSVLNVYLFMLPMAHRM
jgi:hypothetical protein